MLDTKKTDFYPPYLCASEELRDNPGQWQAYESQRNAVVLAGPGSGKTKTMTIKLARLLSEQVSSPQAICCITYSSECVRELLRRLQELGVEPGENLFVGTVHSFCLEHAVEPFRHLCENNLPNPFVVVPHSIKLKILHKALSFVVGVEERPSDWYQRVDAYRRTYIDRDTDEWRLTDAQCAEVAEKYEELLHAEGYIDFEDMIITGTRFIENNAWLRRVLVSKFPIFVVDEYQDLGVALHRMVTTLLDSGARLIAVGDPDQSIYDFAGARPELLIDLAKRQNVEKIELQFNYRSGDKLVAASLAALAEHRNYIAKGKHQGEIFFHHIAGGLDAQAEAICKEIVPSILTRNPDIKLGGIAVLYATQHDGTALVPFVESAGFDYVRLDQGAPYPKTPITRWLEDGANWCADGWKSNEPRLGNIINRWIGFNRRLLSEEERAQARSILIGFLTANRNPEINLLEWLKAFNTACLHQTLSNEPSLRDEQETFANLIETCSPKGAMECFTLREFGGQVGSPSHLKLITIHRAKGLEFDAVIIMGLEQGRLPWMNIAPKQKAEQRRQFYVALTRSKREVHFTYSGFTVNRWGRRFDNGRSEFVDEVERKLRQQEK